MACLACVLGMALFMILDDRRRFGLCFGLLVLVVLAGLALAG